jgi:molybdopterin-guanine dinucleotide biosynthesis protein A
MKHPITGVILAGGLSTRYGGENKAFLRVGGRRIIDRLFETFSGLFEETILVTNRPGEFLDLDTLIVTDIFPVRSSLTGLHTGLFHASRPFAFFAACDAPFLKREIVELVLSGVASDPGTDIVMPRTGAGYEPLCAAYSRRCLKAAEEHLKQGKLKIQLALKQARTRFIAEEALRERDPGLVSFFNVNTPEDLARAESMIRAEAAGGDAK